MVVMDPSWPVFIACRVSIASIPLISPTIILSGLILSEFLTRSLIVISPLPSRLGGLLSSLTTWFKLRLNSRVSSMVIILSSGGMKLEITLRKVVLPVEVAPDTIIFRLL